MESKTRKKILLTGASGTIGFEVLKQLIEKIENFQITVFDVKTAKSIQRFKHYKNQVTIIYGNIYDEDALKQISPSQDVVIHLAAIIPPLADDKPALSHLVNTVGTERLVRIMDVNSPSAFFIYSSSISVYGDRVSNPHIKVTDQLRPSEGDEYGKTKIEAEKQIKSSSLNWTIFRLAAIMGGHKLSKLMFHQPLDTSLEIATPTDTARAFVAAITHEEKLSKQIFNLGGGELSRTTYEEFLSRSFQIYGLGKLNFIPKSFAEKNFHCGYYEDGDKLNDILSFRADTLDTYFGKENRRFSSLQKRFISLLRKPIKSYLQRQSEPLEAHKTNNKKMISHYFNAFL